MKPKPNNNECIDQACLNLEFEVVRDILLKLPASDLIQFYKRHNRKELRLFEEPTFWTSRLPLLHLQEILSSELKSSFFYKYFSSGLHVNHELNKNLWFDEKKEFTRFIKLNRGFLLSEFRESLRRLAVKEADKRLVSEFDIMALTHQHVQTEVQSDHELLLKYHLDEVVLVFTFWYETYKTNHSTLGNRASQIEVEATLIDELHSIIQLFHNKSKIKSRHTKNEQIKDTLNQFQTNYEFFLSYEPILEIVKRSITRASVRNKIELYQCGYVDFEDIGSSPTLRTNDYFRIFRLNDYKKGLEEYYLLNDNAQGRFLTDPRNITPGMNMLRFYGIPSQVNYNNDEINMEKVMLVLQHLSILKGPPDVYPRVDPELKTFHDTFGPNEYISIFEEADLLKNISHYFHWSQRETESLISFLTLDLTGESLPATWINRPLIKLDNCVFWFGTFLKSRRWCNVMLNKLKVEKEIKTVASISSGLETRICKTFEESNFKVIQNFKYYINNEVNGELDIVAFRDGYLFICEVKSGDRGHEYSNAAFAKRIKLEEKAIKQLQRVSANSAKLVESLKKQLMINHHYKELKIVLLIITDYFEEDLSFTHENIKKLTLLELDVTLKNQKRKLFEKYLFDQGFLNLMNQNFYGIGKAIKWDLWEGQLSGEQFVSIMNENQVWKELEQIWKFEPVRLSL